VKQTKRATAAPAPKFLAEAVAAEVLDVKPRTLRQWRWSGRDGPPFYKFGASVKYDLLEVYEFARERRFSSTSDIEAKMAARDGGREPKASVWSPLEA
jgi:hypothetical protein